MLTSTILVLVRLNTNTGTRCTATRRQSNAKSTASAKMCLAQWRTWVFDRRCLPTWRRWLVQLGAARGRRTQGVAMAGHAQVLVGAADAFDAGRRG